LRQKAGLEPKDQIALMIDVAEGVRAALQKHENILKNDVGAKDIEYKRSDKFEAEELVKIEGSEAWIGVRKL
jgi:hypothetical protein